MVNVLLLLTFLAERLDEAQDLSFLQTVFVVADAFVAGQDLVQALIIDCAIVMKVVTFKSGTEVVDFVFIYLVGNQSTHLLQRGIIVVLGCILRFLGRHVLQLADLLLVPLD